MNTEDTIKYLKKYVLEAEFNEENFLKLKELLINSLSRELDLFIAIQNVRNEIP